MDCHRCNQKAAIRMPHHRLQLCKEHYLAWFIEQTDHTIRRYQMFDRSAHILVAVSGGKDSLSLWDVLWRLGYQADGMFINLGIQIGDEHSNRSQQFTEDFAKQCNLKLHVVDMARDYGKSIPEVTLNDHRSRGKPCAVCGLAKRHIMNQAAGEGHYDVLVTGHNLDDEVAVLLGNTLTWDTDLLGRQAPVLEARPGFVRKAKPLCRFYERETTAYALLQQIPYIEEECPYSVGSKQLRYKIILNKLEEERPGLKLNFYVKYLQAREAGLVRARQAEEAGEEAHRCPSCGQLTTSPGLCTFCRLFEPR
ncbi:MAG TPA: ATP-binding protein [Longilinea sp.]|nr:ATP-binding protein [Longilinea sp.]